MKHNESIGCSKCAITKSHSPQKPKKSGEKHVFVHSHKTSLRIDMKEGKSMHAYDEYKRSCFLGSLVYQGLLGIIVVGF